MQVEYFRVKICPFEEILKNIQKNDKPEVKLQIESVKTNNSCCDSSMTKAANEQFSDLWKNSSSVLQRAIDYVAVYDISLEKQTKQNTIC